MMGKTIEKCLYCDGDVDNHIGTCPYHPKNSRVPISPMETMKMMFNLGWECPRCRNIYSPLTSSCSKCNKD